MEFNDAHIPDLVIAGAPKCGSSSLFFWLAAHPSICPSRKKETHFLRDSVNKHNRDLNVHDHGIETYKSFFQHCDKAALKLEATPSYLYERTPIQILSKADPPPTVIFILREPADRLLSSYRFARYRRKNTTLSFTDFADPEGKKLDRPILPYEQSCYSRYLRPWIDAFGNERIKVFLFEKMKEEPENFMKEVADSIGIDPGFYENYNFQQRNASRNIRSKWFHSMGERLQPMIPNKLQEKLLPLYLKLNSGSPPPVSREEIDEKERLRTEFQHEREKLKELFPDLDLSVWEKEKARTE